MESIDILIPAGYTPLPSVSKDQEQRSGKRIHSEDLLIGNDKALMLIEDPRTGKPRPLIYPVLRAALESRYAKTITVLGSKDLGHVLDDLIMLACRERASEMIHTTPVQFIEMYQPPDVPTRSPTLRMDLEQRCQSQNLIRLNRSLPVSGIRMTLGHDLPLLTGEILDNLIQEVVPRMLDDRSSFYYPIIAKETLSRLGRFKRSFIRVIDDRFASGISKKDIYGRIRVKESNVFFSAAEMPESFYHALGSFYSIRKLNHPLSFIKALDILGMDEEELRLPGLRTMKKKLRAVGRAFHILSRYYLGTLTISDAEHLADEILTKTIGRQTPFFRFFEMKYPHFSVDVDSMQDATAGFKGSVSAIKADFPHVARNMEDYLGQVVLLKGRISSLSYLSPPLPHKNRGIAFLASALGYKEVRFSLADGQERIPCYRFKYRNLLFNTLLPAMVDRIYIPDEDSEFLDIEKNIDSILINPNLKYEDMTKKLATIRDAGEAVYVSGRMTGHGIWLHEVIVPDQKPGKWSKYYFRHHCPDPRCEVWKEHQRRRSIAGFVQSTLDKAYDSQIVKGLIDHLK